MDEEKMLDLEAVAENAAQAEAQAEEEATGTPTGVYVHHFKKPFTLYEEKEDTVEEKQVKELTFDWDALTGADHNACCAAVTQRTGLVVVVREFTPQYLTAMAERACTLRSDKGKRVLHYGDLERMRFCDLTKIQDEARLFLRKSEL